MFIKTAMSPWALAWRVVCKVVGLLALGSPLAALSATATGSFSATATVVATCVVSATSVAFGSYSTTQLDSTGQVTVICVNGTSYTVALDAGAGSGASVASRKMTGPSSQTLTYSLYHDSSRSSVWGDVVGTNTIASTGTGIAQVITMYGRIPASQYPSFGVYTDTIAVTLTY